MCEQQGFIPRFYTEKPLDKVDETLADLQGYTRTLITEEMNLGNLIESAVKEMVRQESKKEDEDGEDDETDIPGLESREELDEDDYEEYNNFIEQQSQEDEEMYSLFRAGEV